MVVERNRLLGVGIYTVPEAARLTGVSQQRIRRWLKGYTYPYKDQTRRSPPVWRRELPIVGNSLALSFQDLMEVRFVHAFREAGVSWKTIRFAAQKAGARFRQSHPFSSRRFKTDGRSIFVEIQGQAGEPSLVDIVRDQHAFHQVLAPYLVGVEYDEGENIRRWWPLRGKRTVVIDPARSFGQPIIAKEGVPTGVLARAYQVEESYEVVAKWYAVDPRAVRDAVEFEGKLAA